MTGVQTCALPIWSASQVPSAGGKGSKNGAVARRVVVVSLSLFPACNPNPTTLYSRAGGPFLSVFLQRATYGAEEWLADDVASLLPLPSPIKPQPRKRTPVTTRTARRLARPAGTKNQKPKKNRIDLYRGPPCLCLPQGRNPDLLQRSSCPALRLAPSDASPHRPKCNQEGHLSRASSRALPRRSRDRKSVV